MRLALVLAAGCSVTSIERATPVTTQDVATPFNLTAHDGTRFEPRGDVVLVFYRGHW